jgi:FMN phosphatase YigB (HAD superfamily)
LIILDWDDTLLPSSWLVQQGLQATAQSPLPNEEQKELLAKVAQHIVRTLRVAKRLGTVIVITNAERGWVELTCRHFLPSVVPLLEGMKILSARSIFETSWPGHPVKWKSLAFYSEIADFYARVRKLCVDRHPENVMSIGDSMHERAALIEATELRDCWTKSIKFLDQPTPAQLVRQHRLLSICLPTLVEFKDNADLCLQLSG